jgi:hypothetical protein
MRAVCGVSAALDLEASALRIAARENSFYERRFVRKMRRRLMATGRYEPADFAGLDTLMRGRRWHHGARTSAWARR